MEGMLAYLEPKRREETGTLSLTGGSREFLQARGSLNLPITETLALRVSGMARHREGYIDALQYDDFKLGGEKVWGARAALGDRAWVEALRVWLPVCMQAAAA